MNTFAAIESKAHFDNTVKQTRWQIRGLPDTGDDFLTKYQNIALTLARMWVFVSERIGADDKECTNMFNQVASLESALKYTLKAIDPKNELQLSR